MKRQIIHDFQSPNISRVYSYFHSQEAIASHDENTRLGYKLVCQLGQKISSRKSRDKLK